MRPSMQIVIRLAVIVPFVTASDALAGELTVRPLLHTNQGELVRHSNQEGPVAAGDHRAAAGDSSEHAAGPVLRGPARSVVARQLAAHADAPGSQHPRPGHGGRARDRVAGDAGPEAAVRHLTELFSSNLAVGRSAAVGVQPQFWVPIWPVAESSPWVMPSRGTACCRGQDGRKSPKRPLRQ